MPSPTMRMTLVGTGTSAATLFCNSSICWSRATISSSIAAMILRQLDSIIVPGSTSTANILLIFII